MSLLTKLVLILLGLGFVSYLTTPKYSSMQDRAKQAAVTHIDAKAAAVSSMQLKFSWNKEGFGNVMIANFTIINNGSRDVKDIQITCTHYAPSGTEIDSNTRTIYQIVKAGKRKTIKNFNMGFINSQARSSACNITDLTLL